MKLLFTILLALATLTPARAQGPTLYVLGWVSPLPVQLERVEVTGGALQQVLTSGDGLSGTIAAAADRACVTIVAEGVTSTGAGVRFVRSWQDGCATVWLPVAQTPGGLLRAAWCLCGWGAGASPPFRIQ